MHLLSCLCFLDITPTNRKCIVSNEGTERLSDLLGGSHSSPGGRELGLEPWSICFLMSSKMAAHPGSHVTPDFAFPSGLHPRLAAAVLQGACRVQRLKAWGLLDAKSFLRLMTRPFIQRIECQPASWKSSAPCVEGLLSRVAGLER